MSTIKKPPRKCPNGACDRGAAKHSGRTVTYACGTVLRRGQDHKWVLIADCEAGGLSLVKHRPGDHIRRTERCPRCNTKDPGPAMSWVNDSYVCGFAGESAAWNQFGKVTHIRRVSKCRTELRHPRVRRRMETV